MSSVHGHELMRWLGEHGPMPREALLEGAQKAFGPVTFHTCSIEGLSASDLVDFLMSKGKIAQDPAGLRLAMPPCDH